MIYQGLKDSCTLMDFHEKSQVLGVGTLLQNTLLQIPVVSGKHS
jgi:hypothetical protein